MTLKDALKVLDDDFYLFNCLAHEGPLAFKRSLPKKEELQSHPAEAQYQRGVLAGRSTDDLSNDALRYCYRRGLLSTSDES